MAEDNIEKTQLLSSRESMYNYYTLNQTTPTTENGSVKHSHANGHHINNSRQNLTADDLLNFAGFGPFQVFAFILAGFTYFAYGMDASVFTLTGASVRLEFNLTESEYTILPALTGIPNVFGALIFSFLTDRFGRVWPYAVCLAWIGIASIASAFANSFALLIVLRCVASVAIGAISGLTFPTLVEFLPMRNRGKVMVLVSVLMLVGLCGSYGIGWWLIPTYRGGWRYYIAIVSTPTLLVSVYRLVFHFESPRYLISRGRVDRAWKIFKIIAKFNFKDLTTFVTKEQFSAGLEATDTLNGSRVNVVQRRSLFLQILEIFKPKFLRRTIPLSVLIITESIGYMCSKVFLPDYLNNLGVSVYFTLLVTSVAEIPGILLMSIIVEWRGVGRLNSLRFFSSLSCVLFVILTLLVAFEPHQAIYMPVMLILIYFSAFPVLGLIYTYVSEVYPTSIRSVSTAYFYILQAVSFLGGSFITSTLATEGRHWLFPMVWAGIFAVQLGAGLLLNYEPYGKKLMDVLE